MKRLLILTMLILATGCGGRKIGGQPDGNGTIDPCPPYCGGK